MLVMLRYQRVRARTGVVRCSVGVTVLSACKPPWDHRRLRIAPCMHQSGHHLAPCWDCSFKRAVPLVTPICSTSSLAVLAWAGAAAPGDAGCFITVFGEAERKLLDGRRPEEFTRVRHGSASVACSRAAVN